MFTLLKSKQRAFTLLEVMVAFSLIALLLVVGLGAYREMALLEQQGDLFRVQAFQRRIAQSRLSTLFLHIPPPEPFETKKKDKAELPSRVFYLSDRAEPGLFRPGSLVFTYQNGTDLIPEFCNDVIGRLYIKEKKLGSEEGELWLATWPRPACSMDPSVVRHEFLLDNLKEIHWSFYEPPKEDPEENEHTENPPKDQNGQVANAESTKPSPIANSWNQTWPITYGSLPALVHLKLIFIAEPNKSNEELDLYFPMLQLERAPTLQNAPKSSIL